MAHLNDFLIEDKTLVKYCGQDKKVVIPDGIEIIGKDAFRNNKVLEEVIFPSSLREVGISAFESCYNLHHVSFNDGLKTIGFRSFLCAKIHTIDLPDSVTSVDMMAFEGDNELVRVKLSSGVKNYIWSFREASLLGEIIIPDGVVSFDSTFAQTDSNPNLILKEIHIPEGVLRIKGLAFSHFNGLKRIYLPHSLVYLDELAFRREAERIYIEPEGYEIIYNGTIDEWKRIAPYKPLPQTSIVLTQSTIKCLDGEVFVSYKTGEVIKRK